MPNVLPFSIGGGESMVVDGAFRVLVYYYDGG